MKYRRVLNHHRGCSNVRLNCCLVKYTRYTRKKQMMLRRMGRAQQAVGPTLGSDHLYHKLHGDNKVRYPQNPIHVSDPAFQFSPSLVGGALRCIPHSSREWCCCFPLPPFTKVGPTVDFSIYKCKEHPYSSIHQNSKNQSNKIKSNQINPSGCLSTTV